MDMTVDNAGSYGVPGRVFVNGRWMTPEEYSAWMASGGAGPVDPVAAGLADGTFDRAAYEAAMSGGRVGGPPPGSPPNSIVAPDSPAAADNAGPPDVPNGGPGTPGYTGNSPEADPGPPGFRDTDGNGIDDREQTTVGQTSFGLPYGQMQGMPTLPTGWGSAVNTGLGGTMPADGGGGGSLGGYGSDLGGYPGASAGGTGGPASGGDFTLPGGGTSPFTPGAPPTSNLPDVSQIGAGVTGGGSAGGVMGYPDFQNPLAGTTGTGTGTTGTGSTGTVTGGTTGTPSGGTSLVQNLAGSYQGAIDSANAANENRFASGLELLLKRAEQAGSAIQGLTYEGNADIGRMFGQQRARADQDLINRGLANTTVREGVMRGYATDEQAARNRYADDQTRKNIDENYRQQQGMVDWIGARNDVAPDTGQLASLASGVGAAGPGTTTGTQTTGSTASTQQQNLPAPVGNVVSNPTGATGQRLDVRMDANGNITQSVGGQQLSNPGSSSNSNVLTRGAAGGAMPPPAAAMQGMPPSEPTGAPSLDGYGQSAGIQQLPPSSGVGQGMAPSAPTGAPAFDSTAALSSLGGKAPQQQSPQWVATQVASAGRIGMSDGQPVASQSPPSSRFNSDGLFIGTRNEQPNGFGQNAPLDYFSYQEPRAGGSASPSSMFLQGPQSQPTSGMATTQNSGAPLQTGPMNAPPPGMAGGAMLRNGQVDQSTNDNPDLLGFGANGVAQRGVAGTLQTGPMNAPPPGMAGMTGSTGGSPAYQPPPGMAMKQANDMVSQLQAMNAGPMSGTPTDRPSGAYMPFGKPMGGDFGYADPAKFGTPPASTGSQSLLSVMGNYGSGPSGATPAAPPPASSSLTGAPTKALVDNFQTSPPPSSGMAPPPSDARFNPLALNTPLWQDPNMQMPPQFMQNGQMTPAQFLPTLSRYGVLA